MKTIGISIEKTSVKFNEKRINIKIIKDRKKGDWNWKPQPRLWPRLFKRTVIKDITQPEIMEQIEKLQEKIAEKFGYDLVDHKLELYGRKKNS